MAKKSVNYNKNRITPVVRFEKGKKEEKGEKEDFLTNFQDKVDKIDDKLKDISQKIKNRIKKY